MTETLTEKKCTPCRGGIPPLTHAEAERFQSQTPNWELREAGHRIERTYRFSNFREALGFVRDVGDLDGESKIDRMFDKLERPPDRQ
jgi:4a-hydroxytetrahydrobiopterin dehydratase